MNMHVSDNALTAVKTESKMWFAEAWCCTGLAKSSCTDQICLHFGLDQESQDALQNDWRQGSAFAILKAQNSFGKSDRFLVCMADHIFDPAATTSMCAVQFTDRSDQAFCLL